MDDSRDLETTLVRDAAGATLAHARVPLIGRRFASPLAARTQVGPSGRTWCSADPEALRAGTAPSLCLAGEDVAGHLLVLRDEGFATTLGLAGDGGVVLHAVRRGPISADLDVEALLHDWEAWLIGAGAPDGGGLGRARGLLLGERPRFEDWLGVIEDLHAREPVCPGDVLVAALLGGVDPAIACGAHLSRALGSDRFWEVVTASVG